MKRIVMLSMLLVITVSVTAAGSEVYFNPQEGSAEFCDNVSVEIWANATGFQGGQINLTYDSSCANVTGWERNTTNFLIGGWSHYDGREGITFSTMDPQPVLLTGNYMIGTITIHCVSEEGCETPLAFIDPSRLLDDRGYPVSANWTNGTFSCKNECEGTDTSCGIYPNCENCTEKDGCYVYDNGCEERDYYCESNEEGCNHTYSNRYTDYYEDLVFYCKDDTIWKHRIYHNFSCDGGSCTDHTSWVDEQMVENCSTQCTANNTVKECNGGNCTDTGICNSTICGADVACDSKKPGKSCGAGRICNSTCRCVGLAAPEIIFYAPKSPVNDSQGAMRTFNISINQPVNVSWQINGTAVQTNGSVTEASYTNTSAVVGSWNVSVIVSNANGTDMKTWVWTVTSPCFIATAAYGTALHDDINVLRDFRDEYLMPNPAGRAFVKIYYTLSPTIAALIRDNEGLRTAVREDLIKPLVYVTRSL